MMTKSKPQTATLGDKLKKTLDELEEARIQGLAAKHAADLEKIRKDKAKREKFVRRLYEDIVDKIEAGRVPLVKVDSYENQDWIRKAEKGKAEFQDLWSDFIQRLGYEKLRLVVHEDHDGVGIKSWINVTVEPTKEKIVYRNDGTRQPTTEEMQMDPRPQVDPRIRSVLKET